MITLTGPEIFQNSNRDHLIIFLHGWGSSGENFVHLAKIMSKKLPNSYCIVPNAPFKRDVGMGYQWFSLEERNEGMLYNGMKQVAPIINHFIDVRLKSFHLKDTQLSLVGFSQGAMLAIYLGLTRPQACSSVVAYSGRLILSEQVVQEIKSKPNICMIHGDNDQVVPFKYLKLAVDTLKKHDIKITEHPILQLDHMINEQGIKFGIEFIKQHLIISSK
ncbi:alpha/beta hydrolase [Wolbachia endosymbiont of Howardula sp.]|uniref:alpha/beta hydrolase n=1 Tax=Wolbachia endosymbiont of Howardula sp. TaxID=2916816 RepID=UPI00217D8606|nr:alpha/beta hydrolase [Wolbachia endosymbiont of Howardula sp.]UWI83284.1 alpha/beta hydrolase [Wolbachia endosymbiont of Howardula sp.]